MRAFQEAHDEGANGKTPLNVKETMTSWLVQSGHPTLNVTRNYTTGVTTVVQVSPPNNVDQGIFANSTSKWWIPLTYATKSDLNFSSAVPRSWMSDKEASVTIDGIDKNDWVIFNVRWTGWRSKIFISKSTVERDYNSLTTLRFFARFQASIVSNTTTRTLTESQSISIPIITKTFTCSVARS